ncbi:hypothetical protein [Haladaptatus sp. DYF46]|uniref:WDGH domain-containing protein n=1 Tax=Haladaptatus sp. DYF46 TaxID=2886041 RepID=UPI001E4C6FA5|nr:hypothetical protein [Haladaptatus sp. DYF46]
MSEKSIAEVYEDRNILAEAAARMAHELGFEVCSYVHDEWAVIAIELPTGQVSYHVRPDPTNIPAWIPERSGEHVFDDHTREEKNQRLRQFARYV